VAERLALPGLYLRLIGARVRSQLQYRTSFAIDITGMFFVTFLDFAAVLIIFANVPQLGGWTVEEVALLYATAAVAFSIADLIVGHLDELNQYIRTGTFDVLLLRPRGTLFQVIAGDFQIRRFGKTFQGLVVLVYALLALEIDWTLGRAAMIVTMIVAGAVIYMGVWVVVICVVFWAVEGRETASAFTYGGQFLAQFPVNVYGAWLRRFLAYLFPIAFVAYFPALYVLDKRDTLGLPRALQFASPLVAVATVVAAGLCWRFAVRHYRSAGG
jgi:ABC-2 type transport system permease protein